MFRLSAVAASLACLAPTVLAQASQWTIQWWGDYHCGYQGDNGEQLTDGNPYNMTYTGNSGCSWFSGFEGPGNPENYHPATDDGQYFGSFQLLFTGTEGNGELHPTVYKDAFCNDAAPAPRAAFTENAGSLGTIQTPGCYTIAGTPIIYGYGVTQDGA